VQGIILEDSNGNKRGEMSVTDRGAATIALHSRSQFPCAYMSVYPGGFSAISVRGPGEGSAGLVGWRDSIGRVGAAVEVTDRDNKTVWQQPPRSEVTRGSGR
jgi:hypothetical protein